jgi:hypothetical protein
VYTEKSIIEVPSNPIALDDEDYTKVGYIRLPYKEDQFKEFITGLLGEPQSIDGRILGKFSITITELENLHQLIYQRIISQNKGQLIQFIAKIAYDNKSMVTLNSLNDFVTYNEIKPVIPNAVYLTWTYLIQFPDKDYPEKQQINVSFISKEFYRKYTPMYIMIGSVANAMSRGVVEYKIEHTSRSWGIDIENLLTNQINTIMEKPKKTLEFIKNNSFAISVISSLGITYGLFMIGYKYIYHLKDINLRNVNIILDKLGTDLNGKLNYLTEYVVSGKVNRYSDLMATLYLVSIIAFTIMLVWINTSLDITEESYILLTEKAKEKKKQGEKQIRKQWRMFLFTLITGVLTGVAGNFLYSYLINR